MARPTAMAAAQACGPVSFRTASPTTVATTCPPTRARGCAGSASGVPHHERDGCRERDGGERILRNKRKPLHGSRWQGPRRGRRGRPLPRSGRSTPRRPSLASRSSPSAWASQQKQRGGRSLCRPFRQDRKDYFKLVMAVRSNESLAMPVAPHQLEPTPPGLMGVTLVVPVALNALVKALQLPLFRSVSE